MKASIFMTALAALALNTQTVFADNVASFNVGITDVVVHTTAQKVLSINLDQIKKDETVRILIENDENTVIYDETLIGANVYARHYDLSSLANGEYNLVVEKANIKVIQHLRMHRKGINIAETPNKVIFRPAISQTGDLLKLQMTLDQPGKIKVAIVDSEMNTVFTEKYRLVATLGKVYNLTELPEGTYTLLVTTPDGQYTQSVVVAH